MLTQRKRLRGIQLAALAVLTASGPAIAGGRVDQAPEAVPAIRGVRFFLDQAVGSPGDTVRLHLSVQTEVPLKSLSFAINFDERFLRLESVERIVREQDPSFGDSTSAESIDNRDEVAGDQNVEGWLHIQLSAADSDGELKLPLSEEVRLFVLLFKIAARAPAGFTAVEFKDIGPLRVINQTVILTNAAETRTPEALDAAVVPDENLQGGGVIIKIIGEVGFFVRGDSTMDLTRDISDSVKTLLVLFQGQVYLHCEDAADSNDDGLIDITDPIFTLNNLFTGGDPFPEPNRWGPDPTPDSLGCEES
jgi:hypothetical protein